MLALAFTGRSESWAAPYTDDRGSSKASICELAVETLACMRWQ
jgi:hypothetical protein